MTIEIINGIRVISPDADKWLYKESDQIISDKVYLGVNDTETGWTEITEERKIELEVIWEAENATTDTDYAFEINQKAQAYDIITGGAE